MTSHHVRKWDKAAETFDTFNIGIERRYGKYKRRLFSSLHGKVLMVAAGTGLDFQFFPPALDIVAIDFSPRMVEKAKEKARDYDGKLEVMQEDVHSLPFPDNTFDSAATSCTFCSVPDPVLGLKEICRVLKPGGKIFMFEHVRPGNFFLGAMMDLMTPLTRIFGPDLNRRTADNLRLAGFTLTRDFNVYLDMVKLFEAVKE